MEGDILVRDGVPFGRAKPSAAFSYNSWFNGVVAYEFDANATQGFRDTALMAMQQWQAVGYGTNVRFVPRTLEPSYLHIQRSVVNNAMIGYNFGVNVVNIVSTTSVFTIAHEFGHALGLYHEQSRLDRNTYVTVNYGNVCQDCCRNTSGNPVSCNSNFDLLPIDSWGPYDFDSVMHYDQCAFSIGTNCPADGMQTLVCNPGYTEFQAVMGQTTHLSVLDRLSMSFLYALSDWRFVRSGFGGPFHGTFKEPYGSVSSGIGGTPDNGTLWIDPGTYAGPSTYTRPMVVRATYGAVTLTP